MGISGTISSSKRDFIVTERTDCKLDWPFVIMQIIEEKRKSEGNWSVRTERQKKERKKGREKVWGEGDDRIEEIRGSK